jgi:hypothetical protein
MRSVLYLSSDWRIYENRKVILFLYLIFYRLIILLLIELFGTLLLAEFLV